MKYPNIASTLNWAETPDLAEGLHLQPEECAAIDIAIGGHAEAIRLATENAGVLNTRIETLQGEVTTAQQALTSEQTARQEAANALTTANTALATANARILELEAEGPGTTAGTVKDADKTDAKTKVKAVDMPFEKELRRKYGI